MIFLRVEHPVLSLSSTRLLIGSKSDIRHDTPKVITIASLVSAVQVS